jgi:hypothetical protein
VIGFYQVIYAELNRLEIVVHVRMPPHCGIKVIGERYDLSQGIPQRRGVQQSWHSFFLARIRIILARVVIRDGDREAWDNYELKEWPGRQLADECQIVGIFEYPFIEF